MQETQYLTIQVARSWLNFFWRTCDALRKAKIKLEFDSTLIDVVKYHKPVGARGKLNKSRGGASWSLDVYTSKEEALDCSFTCTGSLL